MSPDPGALIGEPPPSLAPFRDQHARVRDLCARHREPLLADFGRLRPVAGSYSPLGFHFNFPHNAVFAMAVLALLGEDTPNLSLNALLTGEPGPGATSDAVAALARELTAFAAANPEPRGSRSVLGLYYDASAARFSYGETLAALKGMF